jgi:excinuclease UvrABC nuclease subunit
MTRLEDIRGVGPVTAKKLLKNFRSVDGVLKATETELSAVVGPSIAKKIMTSTLLRG